MKGFRKDRPEPERGNARHADRSVQRRAREVARREMLSPAYPERAPLSSLMRWRGPRPVSAGLEVCRRNDRRTPGVRGAGLNPRTRYPAAQRPDADRCARVTAGADVVVCMTCEEEPRPGRPDPLLIYL